MSAPHGSAAPARLIVAAGAAVVGVLLAASIAASGGDAGGGADRRAAAATVSPSSGPTAAPSPGVDAPPDADEQAAFVQALNTDETLVFAEAVRQAPVVEDSEPLLAPGTRVDVDWETFEQFAPGAAAVEAIASDPAGSRFLLALVREDGQWRMVAAEPLS